MFSEETLGRVLYGARPAYSVREMKSDSFGEAELLSSGISLNPTSAARLMDIFDPTQYGTLPVETPESQDAHSAIQVFESLSLEEKFLYLGGSGYTPQSLRSFPLIRDFYNKLTADFTKTAISRLEGLAALYVVLSEVRSSAGFLAALTMYAQTYNAQSVIAQMGGIVDKLFTGGFSPQAELPTWLKKMKEGLYNWKLLVNNPAFEHISKVLSLLVTIGIMEDKTVSLGNFEIFAIEAKKKQCTAVELMDAIVETVVFFAEGGYLCFVSGSLHPLLFSTPKLVELEERYVRKLAEWEHARNGNLSRFLGTTENQFDKELTDLIEEFRQLYKTTVNGTEKKIVQQKWEELTKIHTEFSAIRVSGGLRRSPATVKIHGFSGVGKSTFAEIVMSAMLKAMGVPCTPQYICTLNEKDKHMSNYRSYITGVKIDDYGNTKKEYWEIAPSDTIVKIVNNIREYAIMADLANKGKISIEPSVMTITTNVKTLHAGLTSYNAMSVLRRCHIHVDLRVKKEFETDNKLDSAKVIKKFGTLNSLNDIWDINVEKPIGAGKDGQDFGHFEVIHRDMSITDFVNYAVEFAQKHMAEQQTIVDSFSDASDIVHICSECNKCVETCECCMDDIPDLELESDDDEDEVEVDTSAMTPDAKLQHEMAVARKNIAKLKAVKTKFESAIKARNAIHDKDSKARSLLLKLKREETALREWNLQARTKFGVHKVVGGEIGGDTSDLVSVASDYQPHFGDRLARQLKNKAGKYKHKIQTTQLVYESRVEDMAIDAVLAQLKLYEESPFSCWTNWIPEQWMDNDWIKATIMTMGEDIIGTDVKDYIKLALAGNFFVSLPLLFTIGVLPTAILLCCSAIYFSFTFATVVETKKTAYLERLKEDREALPACFKSMRDEHVKYACGLFAGLAVLYGAVKTYKALRANMSVQGCLQPRTVAEIQARDAEECIWVKPEIKPLDNKGSFVNQDFAWNALRNHLFIYEIDGDTCLAFYYWTKYFVVPYHTMPEEPTKATLRGPGGTLNFILDPTMAYRIPGKDLVMIYVGSGGPTNHMGKHFEEDHVRHPITVAIHGFQGKGHVTDIGWWNHVSDASNGPYTFPGSYYTLRNTTTKPGMCMFPLVSDSIEKKIVGFHIGGRNGTRDGVGVAITSPELDRAVIEVTALSPAHIPPPITKDIEETILGKHFAISKDVHYKCGTNFLPEDATLTVYGSVTGRSTMHSDVVPTPISDTVAKVTGVPNTWSGPAFKQPFVNEKGHTDSGTWIPWYETLKHAARPSPGLPQSALNFAMEDYLSGLREVFDANASYWTNQLAPLTDQETISGRDGERFIDAMVSSTSIGYPIGGPKSKYLEELEPTEDHACPKQFTPEVQAYIYKVLTQADANESLNLIFGANLKDEPRKVNETKVRVFEGAPLVLQFIIRKYFLPIARFLSVNPLIAETAVGINAHGPEWHELTEFIAKFGDDKIVAGDYKKYDVRMPAQLTLSAFAVMMKIASWSGRYSKADLQRMRVIVHEVCTPLIAYNGTLVRFHGTNPSGQNMTVYINSIVNSLLFRYCFFKVYPPEDLGELGEKVGLNRPARFRDVMSLITYGDDAACGTDKNCDRFNHVVMAGILREIDITFTMPDKTSDPRPYMSLHELDFLKRGFRWEPALNRYVGPLAEESIMKSLHAVVKSKALTPKEVACQNVDGALREWFFHGREVFDKRLAQMKQIAEIEDLPCTTLNLDFDERVVRWKEKYSVEDENYQPHSASESDDSGYTIDCDYWGDSTVSEVTDPTPVSQELTIVNYVKSMLGKPAYEEYTIISTQCGQGDLAYVTEEAVLVIECKRVVGREGMMTKVVQQAVRYTNIWSAIFPTRTIYGIIATEYGMQLVHMHGDPVFPAPYTDFLETVPIMW